MISDKKDRCYDCGKFVDYPIREFECSCPGLNTIQELITAPPERFIAELEVNLIGKEDYEIWQCPYCNIKMSMVGPDITDAIRHHMKLVHKNCKTESKWIKFFRWLAK